jgi:hypothetical protein
MCENDSATSSSRPALPKMSDADLKLCYLTVLLARFHLAQFTTLKSTFWVRNGTVDENVIEFWTVRGDGGMILAYTDAKYCKACKDFSSGNSPNIDLASQAFRKRGAFGFNSNCLLSVKGCPIAADLLPAIHHD